MSSVRAACLAPLLLALASCGGERAPPPSRTFSGLPVSGTLADARRLGFTACRPDTTDMRCRREGVMFAGKGPFSAAVDLVGSDGGGGFDHLTLWHDSDQSALVGAVDTLRDQGWSECLTPAGEHWQGEAIYQRRGAPVFVALDLSYWSKRRLTVYPATAGSIPTCRPS
ncbi:MULTISPECIES: hypothetical protein [Sphingomonas]|uniref:hypothetical protein n=1 Tax=Sphingomonas TaxID=13687 RepID=UPI001F084D01|nr:MULTISPECIES: hypothetical protein [Sphingomonas]